MSDIYKVIVAGGRNFNNYTLLTRSLEFYFRKRDDIEIVSGTASGADSLGERFAREKGFLIKQFPAQWSNFQDKPLSEIGQNSYGKYWKKAGYARNEEMAKYANALVAFWDNKSRGTKHMIDLANKYNLAVRIVSY